MKAQRKFAFKITIGVILCIVAFSSIIGITALTEHKILPLSIEAGEALGAGIWCILIAVAVVFFVTANLSMGTFKYLNNEELELLYGVEGIVEKKKEEFHSTYTAYMALGIMLCILSFLPPILADGFSVPFIDIQGSTIQVDTHSQNLFISLAPSFMFFMIAAGVALIVYVSIIQSGFSKLLQTGDYSQDHKKSERIMEPISALFWISITIIYLLVSFLTGGWGLSWLIWVIAGMVYALISVYIHHFKS